MNLSCTASETQMKLKPPHTWNAVEITFSFSTGGDPCLEDGSRPAERSNRGRFKCAGLMPQSNQ